MFTIREILYTAAVPAAIALAVLSLSWRPWRGDAAALTVLALLDAVAHAFVHVPGWVRAETALVASALLVLCLFSSLLQSDTWPGEAAAQWMVGMVVVLHVAWT